MKRYQVQSVSGLCVKIVEAVTPHEAVAKWLNELCPLTRTEEDIRANMPEYKLAEDGIHILVS